MSSEERRAFLAEADRLGGIVLTAQGRYWAARLRGRAAYKAQLLRAKRRYEVFALTVRDRGFYLSNDMTAHVLHEMDEQQRAEYRVWRGIDGR